ncbi:MAG TPA: DivIVA domain-containing protein [Acidimicrobiia bacterium]|nr:DivIVA domain-containing protein [Acidimicrobiia bacterium]
MPITPADIEKKTFSTALRGYDLDEVDDFLDEMVVAVRELEEELARAKERVAQLENDPEAMAVAAAAPAPPGPDESAVGRALIAAQAAADRMLEEARTEADQIVGGARSEADTFAMERDQKKAAVDAEMAEMTGLVAGVRNKLAVLATTVADKLDEMDAVVAGAHSRGPIESETDTGTADSDDGLSDDGSADLETFDVESQLVENQGEDQDTGDDSSSVEGAGLEVDLEDLETDHGEDAGSSEIEGEDREENQEI